MGRIHKSIWAILHLLAIACVLMSLSTGLRIAILEYPFLLKLHNFLPQGEMHHLHLYSGWALTIISIVYAGFIFRKLLPGLKQFSNNRFDQTFHKILAIYLRINMVLLLATGWLLFIEAFNTSLVKEIHFVAALGMLVYIILHGFGYFIQFGIQGILRIFKPVMFANQYVVLLMLSIGMVSCIVGWGVFENTHHKLNVLTVDSSIYLEMDGEASEAPWFEAKTLTLQTHGGANFEDGSTNIAIKALQNGHEIFFHFRWEDSSESLAHLPLVKTVDGWKPKQDGFYEFDEQTYYEDKFAVIVSDSCELNAAGTAHLGAQPLNDKPKPWHGAGYHYREQGIVDLWHWKAVRTNSMHLMDDNYIGQPVEPRAGDRRYTAGYHQDARESGAYKMNWKWYTPDGIVPKRLPLDASQLDPYQPDSKVKPQESPWILPWFGSQPYKSENDTYPIGTVMPSILYTSNQFEGDRAHVRGFAKWQDGYWSLEVFRKLDTQSKTDIKIEDGVCIWVAAFDHAQVGHTRHVRPIKLEFKL